MANKILYWIPRILSVLFALFISLFALDVFSLAQPFLEVLAAFLIHLIPTAIVIVALIIAARNGIVGGVLFILIGAAYIFYIRGFSLGITLTFGGIPILIGLLFILEGFLQRKARQAVEQEAPEGED